MIIRLFSGRYCYNNSMLTKIDWRAVQDDKPHGLMHRKPECKVALNCTSEFKVRKYKNWVLTMVKISSAYVYIDVPV